MLAAAAELFAEQGAATQLLDIAKRAGVGAGTVYRHFPSKENLFVEVIAARLAELLDQASSLSADYGPSEAFFAFWALASELAYRDAALCDAFASSTAEEFKIPDRLRARFQSTLANMLEAAQAVGSVRDDIDVLDATALLSASVLAEQRGGPSSRGGRLAGIVAGALRPSRQR